MMSVLLITGNSNLDHLLEVMFDKFLHFATCFPFSILYYNFNLVFGAIYISILYSRLEVRHYIQPTLKMRKIKLHSLKE